MKIVTMSDTHGNHKELDVPSGDVLVFAGDFMTCGLRHREVISFSEWIESLPFKHKIIVPGNHDRLVELDNYWMQALTSVGHVLVNSGVTIDGIKFYGYPYTPAFGGWAYQSYGEDCEKFAYKIPKDTDVLITHGPPYGILDQSVPERLESTWGGNFIVHPGEHLGDEALAKHVERVNPKIHIFGHIHGSYGKISREILASPTLYVNTAICDEQYNPTNKPWVLEI